MRRHLPRPEPFRLCGNAGLAAAAAVALTVSATNGGSAAVELAIVAMSVAVFGAVARMERAFRGSETLVYYHHAIPVLSVAGLLAWVLGAHPLLQLDATALGLGAFLCCGRVGCFLSGCCYGRPWRHGVACREHRLPPTFPDYLVGQRLVAVPLLESGLVLLLLALGLLTLSHAAGSAFAVYVSGYAVVRFSLEELRGDPVRPYWRGLSEAQWTCLMVAVGAAAAAQLGLLPLRWPLLSVAAALLAGAALIVAARARSRALLHPAHVHELVSALPDPAPGRPRVARTATGLHVSAGVADGLVTYTLSRADGGLGDVEAAGLAGVIRSRRHPSDAAVLVPGAAGAYHVVIEPRRIPVA